MLMTGGPRGISHGVTASRYGSLPEITGDNAGEGGPESPVDRGACPVYLESPSMLRFAIVGMGMSQREASKAASALRVHAP